MCYLSKEGLVAAGLEEEDSPARHFRQPVRDHRARGSRSDNNKVVIRLNHLEKNTEKKNKPTHNVFSRNE